MPTSPRSPSHGGRGLTGNEWPTFNSKNASYRTHGELPTIGSRAPDVSLVNTELQNVSLANWMGMRKMLNIFVSIDTEVCAKSVIEFDRLRGGHDDVAC